jgi:hypothetical protein
VKLTTHLQPVPRSRNHGTVHPFPIHLHGVLLNGLSKGTSLPLPVAHSGTEGLCETPFQFSFLIL